MLPTAEIRLTSYNANIYEPSDVSTVERPPVRPAPLAPPADLQPAWALPVCMRPTFPPQDSFLLVDALQIHAAKWEASRPAL